jgi:hypothetical protein
MVRRFITIQNTLIICAYRSKLSGDDEPHFFNCFYQGLLPSTYIVTPHNTALRGEFPPSCLPRQSRLVGSLCSAIIRHPFYSHHFRARFHCSGGIGHFVPFFFDVASVRSGLGSIVCSIFFGKGADWAFPRNRPPPSAVVAAGVSSDSFV